jgi:bifunctional DNase/RNase
MPVSAGYDAVAVQRMTIYGVSFELVGKQPVVLLKTAESNRFLPIWIGQAEAQAILLKLQGTEVPRPMTHDLMLGLLGELDASIERIAVTELRDNTFYARITLVRDGGRIEVDSRPSDAIALAVRCDAPIYASDEVIEASAIEMEDDAPVESEEQIEEFRRFLEDVRPEDFLS